MRINYQRNHMGMLAVVFSLMAITLYMAFAFPYSLLHFKQSETTEIKAVIIVARHGEVTPSREIYFDTFGEEPPEAWFQLGGSNQLTSTGKERMFLLGKFLKLHYYERLLGGNPRKLHVRSENSDRSLESAQALLAGLNPPQDDWVWARPGDSPHEFAANWQPKAVHTQLANEDDLLSSQSHCLELESLRATWKNSSRYLQLLNEFRHDLQVLRQNTGLVFEDDLEMLTNLEEQMRARASFDGPNMPSWYTSTFAQRLAYIADVTTGCRFQQETAQRLHAGRLLDTLVRNIFSKIRSDLTAGISLLNENDANDGASSIVVKFNGSRAMDEFSTGESAVDKSKLLPRDEQLKLKLERQLEPNMFVYLTDKQHLSALMNSLKIYASQPHYGAALIIELHYDPANQVHFLRLFLVNSLSHNVLPEPVRVNPIACVDSIECSPQQFDQNLRHLALDRTTWMSACTNLAQFEQQEQWASASTTTSTTASPTTTDTSVEPVDATEQTELTAPLSSSINNTGQPADSIHIEKLDESLVVGPSTDATVTSEQPTTTYDNTREAQQTTASTIVNILNETLRPALEVDDQTTTTIAATQTTSETPIDQPSEPAEGLTDAIGNHLTSYFSANLNDSRQYPQMPL